MKASIRTLCYLAGLALGPVAAEAATMVTPALQVNENGRVFCALLNPTSRDVPIDRFQLVFDDGRVLETFPGGTLRTGLTLQLQESAAGAGVGGGLWHCRVDVAGSAKKLRLSMCTIGADGSCNGVATAP